MKHPPKKGEIYVGLIGKRRDDGSMFITSPNLALFSAIVQDRDWDSALALLKAHIEANLGKVTNLRFVDDPPGVEGRESERLHVPPAHVVGELVKGAHSRHVGA